MIFGNSVERFLLVFIINSRNDIPQHMFYEDYGLGRGTVTSVAKHLEDLGIIERVKCYSERKRAEVVCYRLTEKGRLVVECLRKAYEALGLKPLPGGG